MYVMVFYRASESPKAYCPLFRLMKKRLDYIKKTKFLIQIHTDFWSTSNFRSDCIKYTSTVEINVSEIGTASIPSVSQNSILAFSPHVQSKSYTLRPLIIARSPIPSSRISMSYYIIWLSAFSFSRCGKYLRFPKDVSGLKSLPRNVAVRDCIFYRVYPEFLNLRPVREKTEGGRGALLSRERRNERCLCSTVGKPRLASRGSPPC